MILRPLRTCCRRRPPPEDIGRTMFGAMTRNAAKTR